MEEEFEKPFGAVHIILMMMLVIPDAILKLAGDLLLAIPAVGEIAFFLADVYSIFVWIAIIFWFVFKLGVFGGAGLALTVGGLLDIIGLPGSLLAGTIIAIYLANHPKTQEVASIVTLKPAGAMEGAALKEASIIERGAAEAESAGSAAEAAAAREAGVVEREALAEEKTAGKALGEAQEPMEELEQQLTEETPQVEKKLDVDESENKSFKDRVKERLREKAENAARNPKELPRKEQEEDEEEPPMSLAA